MKKRGNTNAKGIKKSLRGGGNREKARVACLFDDLAAKQLRSQAAKSVTGNTESISPLWRERKQAFTSD